MHFFKLDDIIMFRLPVITVVCSVGVELIVVDVVDGSVDVGRVDSVVPPGVVSSTSGGFTSVHTILEALCNVKVTYF